MRLSNNQINEELTATPPAINAREQALTIAGAIGTNGVPVKIFGCDQHQVASPSISAVEALIEEGMDPAEAWWQAAEEAAEAEAEHLLKDAEENGWPIGDSADPDWNHRGFVVQTRCSIHQSAHSHWAYGFIYTSVEAAIKAGHTHEVECASCGERRYPLS